MKIAFLSHNDINLYLFRLPVMKELARLGHEVYAIAPKGPRTAEFARHGLKTVTFVLDRGSLSPVAAARTVISLRSVLVPLRLDVLHAFMAKPTIFGALAVKGAGIPLFVSSVTGLGSYFIADDLKSRAVRALILKLYRRALRGARAVIFQNGDDLEAFVKAGVVEAGKTRIIKGSGIDTDLWRPQARPDPKGIVVFMAGRTLRHKGVVEFAEAARLVKARRPDVHFVFAGPEDKANPSNLPRAFFDAYPEIEYLGERRDMRELMNACDVFVLPSYREGLPRTVIEAASLGKPSVVTDAPGCREAVIAGQTGLIVPARDARVLAEAIERLVTDEALRRRMGEAARLFAEREHDVRRVVKQHLEVYGIA